MKLFELLEQLQQIPDTHLEVYADNTHIVNAARLYSPINGHKRRVYLETIPDEPADE